MIISFLKKEEKKVEYIELIYDLIFVYIIGRNNSLIHPTDGGFIPLAPYLTYLLTTLAALHIWYLTTLFINRYGSKSVSGVGICGYLHQHVPALLYGGRHARRLAGLLLPIQHRVGIDSGQPRGAVSA